MDGVYETLFVMKMHGHWSFFESHALPVRLRKHFAERLVKHVKEMNEAHTNN